LVTAPKNIKSQERWQFVIVVLLPEGGSAFYFQGVSIPAEYKLDNKERNIQEIVSKSQLFYYFNRKNKDFDEYRNIIKSEPGKFLSDPKIFF